MIEVKIREFVNSSKYALEIDDFEPEGGVFNFFRDFCAYLDEDFLSWEQGPDFAMGLMSYRGHLLRLFSGEFPCVVSIDCIDKKMAKELGRELADFLLINFYY